MELILPSAEYKDSYIAAVKEFKDDRNISTRGTKYLEISLPELEQNFPAYVQKVRDMSEGKGLPKGWLPQTDYWLVDNGEYIGCVSIRHRLNEHLLHVGGHIGYDIRPSMRGKGYGTGQLQLALPKAKELGIERLLITCDERNIASQKIIERAGGTLEDIRDTKGGRKVRYWISL